MEKKDIDLDDLVNFINNDKKGPSQVSNVKKVKTKKTEALDNPEASIVEQFTSEINLNSQVNEVNEENKEGEGKKKKRRRRKNKKEEGEDEEEDEENEEIRLKEEARKKNKEMFKSFFNIDTSQVTTSKFQDNSKFRVLGNWKEVDKDKGQVYNQTNIPTIQIEDQFKNGVYPENEIQNYKDQDWRCSNEEKRALERIAYYDIQKLRKAAEAQRQVRKYAQMIIKPGERLIDICDKIENMNRYLINAQGPDCGIGFPTGISINHCAAHYTPNPGDFRVLTENDVCKIDFGTQVNGLIIDTAFTVAFNSEYDDLLIAVQEATNTGIKESGIDVRLGDIGAAIQEVMESYEVIIKGKTYQVKSVKNLCGHSIEPYKIHAGKSVPIVKKQDFTKMEEGELFAIETFGSTGK